MQKKNLGKTSIRVSKLCFGSLTMTPFQANLSIEEGAELINYAYKKGINFLDTAEYYDNYAYINKALKTIDRKDYILATKTYAYTKELAKKSLDKALTELDTDYIDILLLHEQESEHTIRGHYEALEYLLKAKDEGLINAVGISTHKVEGVKGFKKFKELDILHPIVNIGGIGILDGSLEEMLKLIRELSESGRGIYAMKPLGGGHLRESAEEALTFVLNQESISSVAIGIQSKTEIDANVQIVENGYIEPETKAKLKAINRRLVIHDYCIGCGNCVRRCQQNAIELVDNKAVVNEKCIICGYCAKTCPEFCIKVV